MHAEDENGIIMDTRSRRNLLNGKGGVEMTEAIVNVGEIFVKYGLSVEKVEPMVYKVLNQDKEVNVSRLQWDLRQCFLITPVRHKAKRMPDGYTEYYSKVYYVITECDYSLANKYEESLCGDVTSMRYDYTDYLEPYMGTFYRKEEIETHG